MLAFYANDLLAASAITCEIRSGVRQRDSRISGGFSGNQQRVDEPTGDPLQVQPVGRTGLIDLPVVEGLGIIQRLSKPDRILNCSRSLLSPSFKGGKQ
ncbi:hypothetical protein HUE56_04515 (plasmid) [Azospirillum oryzae]|uniref:Uncharacterized protein n=1 Tax=Azospirillum oryzae TaxID=286727 RepID=A0A6N1ANT8_9PROT|nr:hypothetical protein [Azospirillum oryzae]KAA0584515.1 hypothetical protein FZ938_29535 [Azospirillum oryzae]QKS49802.1 hypothetical protein HUE56_04515 [Azospirillum oryzae]